MSSYVPVATGVEVGLDSVSDFEVVLVVASRVAEGVAVGRTRLAGRGIVPVVGRLMLTVFAWGASRALVK